jgi:hypothetical protein
MVGVCKVLKKKVLVTISIVLAASILSVLVWSFYRYETTVLALNYEANPIASSPLSSANYSWKVKAYNARIFGNSPFNNEGYIYRERIMSDNKFQNTEFHNLNVTLRLRFQITNSSGYMLCNKTLDNTDGSDRQVIFEIEPKTTKTGDTLQIRIKLSLNINYSYGVGGELKQFTLQKEWTNTIQVQQTEPATGVIF